MSHLSILASSLSFSFLPFGSSYVTWSNWESETWLSRICSSFRLLRLRPFLSGDLWGCDECEVCGGLAGLSSLLISLRLLLRFCCSLGTSLICSKCSWSLFAASDESIFVPFSISVSGSVPLSELVACVVPGSVPGMGFGRSVWDGMWTGGTLGCWDWLKGCLGIDIPVYEAEKKEKKIENAKSKYFAIHKWFNTAVKS